MRILHLAGRLGIRGGADWHMRGVLEQQARLHSPLLAVEHEDDVDLAPDLPVPRERLANLDARASAPVDLDPLAASFRPDRIHVHNVVNPTVLEWAANRDAVVTVQDHRFFCPGRGKWTAGREVCRVALGREACAACFEDRAYFESILRRTLDRLAALKRMRVVVLSRYMRDELTAAGLDPSRVHVIPPFVHGLDLAARAEGAPCVLFVGRLVEAKGVRDAVAAWQRSGVEEPLVFAGTGPLRQELESRGFEVLGWVPHDRLAGLYRRARAVLLPSRWQEPFGIVGLEALTLGVPVVAWDSGGVREWHPGPGLVEWGDVDGLADALRRHAGSTVLAPSGFERAALTARLERVYESPSA